ncbi:hypothetical protein GCM10023084_24440 [Streptomyces lacrimifluminis]|uniref:SnoaL-like domain-containing protein n=1 Tax=Streptomyces lacrimifluminis TaxID=1500077 RepID=A0A917NNT6_9ACTN|nr:nuclear transport factor 2 family protein [Streptomyces lacrimifluminis]GGJ14760.1 hypothetical protein GCM10012282_08810 [Streptomyces lacrimifluminis]
MTTPSVQTELYLDIQQFYAEHMQAVDDGDYAVCALGYTEDALFDTDALPAPLAGRATIMEQLSTATAGARDAGIRRRHFMSMLTVRQDPARENTVHTRSNALVVATPPGGVPAVQRSVIWEDTLVYDESEGRWRIKMRRVRADGAPGRAAG